MLYKNTLPFPPSPSAYVCNLEHVVDICALNGQFPNGKKCKAKSVIFKYILIIIATLHSFL